MTELQLTPLERRLVALMQADAEIANARAERQEKELVLRIVEPEEELQSRYENTPQPESPKGRVFDIFITQGAEAAEALAIKLGVSAQTYQSWLSKLRNRYSRQQCNYAKSRGWLFTFETWLKLWIESGHIDNDKCRMIRINDCRPYSPSNVKIVSWPMCAADVVGKTASGFDRASKPRIKRVWL